MVTLSKKIVSEKDEIWLDEGNMAHIRVFEGFDFDEKDLARQFRTYGQLGLNENNRRPVLVDATLGFTINKEARDLVGKESGAYFSACAVVSDSLATRMIVNFFNSFYNFGLPIKLFSNEAQALKWLKQYQ